MLAARYDEPSDIATLTERQTAWEKNYNRYPLRGKYYLNGDYGQGIDITKDSVKIDEEGIVIEWIWKFALNDEKWEYRGDQLHWSDYGFWDTIPDAESGRSLFSFLKWLELDVNRWNEIDRWDLARYINKPPQWERNNFIENVMWLVKNETYWLSWDSSMWIMNAATRKFDAFWNIFKPTWREVWWAVKSSRFRVRRLLEKA